MRKQQMFGGSVSVQISIRFFMNVLQAEIETDPIKMAHMMIAHIDKKRKALGIDKARDRVLYDMAMRRELEK